MTARIANLASNNTVVTRLLQSQSSLQDLQTQISTGKLSQTYAGISVSSERLVNLKNTRDVLKNYSDSNSVMDLRLKIASTATEAIQTTIKDFKGALDNYASGNTTDATKVKDIQDWAFRALKDMQGFLNTAADGRYIFGGGSVNTKPVEFGLTDLGTLQAKYDGARVSYPTTRDGQLADFTINKDVVTEQTNWLTFERDNGGSGISRITATSNNDFKNAKVGATITVSGTSSNDGTYTIKSVDTTNYKYITVETEMLTTRANDVGTGVGVTLTGADGTSLSPADFTDLSFDRAAGTITAASGTPFSGLSAGQYFTVANATDAGNNGTFTIDTVTSTVITIKQKKLTDEGTATTKSVSYTTTAGDVTFNDNSPNADTIVIANTTAGAEYSKLKAGMKITMSGAATGANNATFTVDSVSTSGNTVTITIAKNESLTAAAPDANAVTFTTTEAAGTITASSYYNGDSIAPTHRIDSDRSFDMEANAIDPAFEKAIRAMFIIAQGKTGTEGGLDQNASTRIDQAKFLLSSTLDSTTSLTGATGTELTGNIEKISLDISFNQVRLTRTNEANNKFVGFLEKQISKSEDADHLETITRLLDGSRALEASYQALARIRKLSLVNFL